MTPIQFKQANTVYAKDQPEYLPLPAYRDETETISLWQLSLFERIKILFTGKLWLRQMNFGNALQPQKPIVNDPFTCVE